MIQMDTTNSVKTKYGIGSICLLRALLAVSCRTSFPRLRIGRSNQPQIKLFANQKVPGSFTTFTRRRTIRIKAPFRTNDSRADRLPICIHFLIQVNDNPCFDLLPTSESSILQDTNERTEKEIRLLTAMPFT